MVRQETRMNPADGCDSASCAQRGMCGTIACRDASEPDVRRRFALRFSSVSEGRAVLSEMSLEPGGVVIRRVVLECVRIGRRV